MTKRGDDVILTTYEKNLKKSENSHTSYLRAAKMPRNSYRAGDTNSVREDDRGA